MRTITPRPLNTGTKMQTEIQAQGKHLPADTYLLTGSLYQADRSPALQLSKDGEPWMTLTCCLPEHALAHGQVLIKSWGENEGVAENLIESGVLIDTGERVPTGFCEAMVCTLGVNLT